MRLKICIYECGPEEFIIPSVGLRMLLFFKVVLNCLFMFVLLLSVLAVVNTSSLFRHTTVTVTVQVLLLQSRLFKWIQHDVNFTLTQDTLFSF